MMMTQEELGEQTREKEVVVFQAQGISACHQNEL